MTKKKVLVKGKAGMGNRILSLLDAIIYADFLHRQVVVDWSDFTYSHNGKNAFPNYFTVSDSSNIISFEDVATMQEEIGSISSVHPIIWKDRLNLSVAEIMERHGDNDKISQVNPFSYSKYTVNLKEVDHTEEILVRWAFRSEISKIRCFFHNGFLETSRLSNMQILRQIFHGNLLLARDIQCQIENFKLKNFSNCMIGVHIRYTDRKTAIERYHKAISSILVEYPDATIFLATDNKEVESLFKKMHRVRICTCEKWYPKAGNNLHQNPECPDRFLGGTHALVDMYLLAACDFLVCDQNSSFSYIASLISDIPDSRIFDVSKYGLKRLSGHTRDFLGKLLWM